MTIAERVTELHTAFGRLVNGRGPRVERLTLCVTAQTRERITAMAEQWQTTRSGVAAEVLEAAMPEAWAAFKHGREAGRRYTPAEILACGCEPEIEHCAHCDGCRAANAAFEATREGKDGGRGEATDGGRGYGDADQPRRRDPGQRA